MSEHIVEVEENPAQVRLPINAYAYVTNLLRECATAIQELRYRVLALERVATARKRITLCGSTRFKRAWLEWNARLTLEEGAVVYSVAMWSHTQRLEPSQEQKELLDDIHKAKIDASDEIFVLDVGGYVGSSTLSEIEHAARTGKRVRYLSQEFPHWTEASCQYAQDDLAAAIANVNKKYDIEIAGWNLSTYAASINWNGARNTPEWLRGLHQHIMEFQQAYEAQYGKQDGFLTAGIEGESAAESTYLKNG